MFTLIAVLAAAWFALDAFIQRRLTNAQRDLIEAQKRQIKAGKRLYESQRKWMAAYRRRIETLEAAQETAISNAMRFGYDPEQEELT